MGIRPDISVIVPCYNAEKYLDVCLSSLRAQTVPEIEIILINDGSTDRTGEILHAYQKEDPRVRLIETGNHGVSAARNLGIDQARGSYLAFLDADDAFEKDALSRLYQGAVRSGADIISANHTLFDQSTRRRERLHITTGIIQPSEIVRELIHMHRIFNNIWNKLYRADLFRDGPRLNENIRIGEDVLLNLRLYLHVTRVQHIQEGTYVYRVHEGSAMKSITSYSDAHQPMLHAMSQLLLEEGVKEKYFCDFLQSCVWLDEKERGIRECMKHFNDRIRPLVLEGIDESRIPKRDMALYRRVIQGNFPGFYYLMRIREKTLHRTWRIKR